MRHQNRIMLETACGIARKTHSKGVLLYGDMIEDYEALNKIGQEKQVELILAIKDEAFLRMLARFLRRYFPSLMSLWDGLIK